MKPIMQISVCKTTGIAKEHSINKISIVMIVGKFKIMRSGLKAVTVYSICWRHTVSVMP